LDRRPRLGLGVSLPADRQGSAHQEIPLSVRNDDTITKQILRYAQDRDGDEGGVFLIIPFVSSFRARL